MRAIDIASRAIEISNEERVPITNLRLQNILYFSQGIGVRELGKAIIEDNFVAGEYGPMIPSIYRRFMYKGALPIRLGDLTHTPNTSSEVDELLREIIIYTKDMSDGHLSNIVHRHPSWKDSYREKGVITKDRIQEQFSHKEDVD